MWAWTEEELALFREDDQRQIEHRQFMASPEAQTRSLARKPDAEGAEYRAHDEDATPAPAEPETDWLQWQAWLDGHLANEREAMLDGVAEFVVRMLDQERVIYERRIAELEGEIRELKGLTGGLLTLLGQRAEDRSKSGQVVDLPNWRKRHVA